MTRCAMLILPSANRASAGAAAELIRAELAVFSDAVLGGALSEAAPAEFGGVPYLVFETGTLSPRALSYLANVSGCYALFEVSGDLLRPLDLRRLDRYDDHLITIQKYPGKTNEQFTKLLMNVTLLASAWGADMPDRKLAVLDPLCGRGTTRNQALMYGYDAAGVDLDQRDYDAYTTFIKTWLKRKRIKHKADYDGPVRREGKTAGRRLQVSLAAAKDEYRSGQTQRLDVVCADTTRAPEFFKAGTFDLVVTDAPYGIQHGSRSSAPGLARQPLACWRLPRPPGHRCCGLAVRSASPGTLSWRPAPRSRRSWPTPAWTRSSRRHISTSGTESIRASPATSLSPAKRASQRRRYETGPAAAPGL